jgi:hypothetical protein
LLKARSSYEAAAKQLQAAAGQINTQLAALPPDSTDKNAKAALEQAKVQAEFEEGLNYLEQTQTYTDRNEDTQRGEVIKKAKEILEKLSKRDPRDALAWQALAWLGRCYVEDDDPKTARKLYMEVINERSEQAETARRLAKFFRMKAIAKDVDVKNKPAQIQQAAEEWLASYPGYVNTEEGFGVRFDLAETYRQQAEAAPKNSPRATELYKKAETLYDALDQGDSEFAAEAHNNKLRIVLTLSQERTKGDISKLRDFQECYLRAQLEGYQLSEAPKKFKNKELEQKRKEYFANMLEALNKALDLADEKVTVEQRNEARYLLVYAYLASEDYYRAAIAGEDLARNEAKSVKAPLGGAYALRAYAAIIGKEEQAGTPKEEAEPDRARLRSLAQYIEQTWPADQAADTARHMQAMLLLTDKNFPEAVEMLGRITPNYSDRTRALYQLAGAALMAEADKAKLPAGKPAYLDTAVAALTSIPDVTSASDAATIHDYFGSKLMLAGIYYRGKKYAELDALADALTKRLETMGAETRAEQGVPVLSVNLYAKLGHAMSDFNAGQYAKAREALDPVVQQVKDPAMAAQITELKEKDSQLLKFVLGLAIRSNVQDNQLDRAKEIMDLAEKTFPDNSIEILVQLVQELREQVQQLRKQGDSAKEQLDKTIANFTTFLDQLTAQQQKSPKPEITLFLAQSYSSLDNHKKAAELLSKIPAPKPPEEGKPPPDPKAQQVYNAAQILNVRELRLAKEFDQASSAVTELLKGWGQNNLEVKKEEILLLEDQDKFSGPKGAITRWVNLMKSLQPRLQNNNVKEHYFDCYYHLALCMYKNAAYIKDPKKKQKAIRDAANFILRLEAQQDDFADPTRKRFQELMENEAVLRKEYEALKKGAG